MKDIDSKVKKWTIIAGLSLLCITMLVLIGGKFVKVPLSDDILKNESTVDGEMSTKHGGNENQNKDLVLPSNTEKTSIDDTSGADSKGTKQSIQPDPKKVKKSEMPKKPDYAVASSKPHEIPKTPELTNPDKKPDSKPIPSEPAKSKEPQVKQGEIYIPGFGGIVDEGGGGQGEASKLDPEHTDFDKIIGH